MAVKVTGNGPAGQEKILAQHGEGAGVDVRDGHLAVTTDPRDEPVRWIAVYAPGSWTHAEVTK
jgi:hypothetical protein